MKNRIALIMIALLVLLTSYAHADDKDAAQIKIKIVNPVADNRYFLCLPGYGCFSIHAAQQGKIYPIFQEIKIRGLFITNFYKLRLFNVGLPPSCAIDVAPGQTITVYGKIQREKGDRLQVQHLHCVLTRHS